MGQKISLTIMFFLLYSLLEESSAYAYLDPGTGSMLLQLLLGGLAGLAVILKLFWHRIISFLGIVKEEK